jgi:1,2-dihydroxy-3-keto-5-methylthiopentene dioxygenase
MPCLSVYAEDHPQHPYKVLGLPEHISANLSEIGVYYAHCQPEQPLGAAPTDAELLAAYHTPLAQLREQTGYQQLQVVRQISEKRPIGSLHAHCLDEHSHNEAEVHLFVAGQALISLHAAGMLHELLCERGDLLIIPAGTLHWFDGGEPEHWVAIRALSSQGDTLVKLSGESIASRFTRLNVESG